MANSQLSSEQKLDMILSKISEVKQLVKRVATLETLVSEQDIITQHLSLEVKSLSSKVKTLKEKANAIDQLLKGNAFRLFRFPGSNDEMSLHQNLRPHP